MYKRAFRPPSFIAKPQSEKSKVDSQLGVSSAKKSPDTQSTCTNLQQPVKRRRLLVSPVSLPDSAKPAFESRKVRQQQLQPDDRSPQHVGPEEASKTAPIMPIPLPEVAMELPGHSHSITSNGLDLQPSLEPCLIPAEMPLLLSASVIHRMQAALIPKQSPCTSPYTTDRQHHDDSFWMKHICLPGQWARHGRMAKVHMPSFSPAAVPGGQSLASKPSVLLSQQKEASPPTTACGAFQYSLQGSVRLPISRQQQQLEQLLPIPDLRAAEGPSAALMPGGEQHGTQSRGSKAPCQMQSGCKHSTPASTDAAGIDQAKVAASEDDQHAAMLAQLELQDREMKEVLRSPEKQLAEVMKHPFPVLGLELDMALLKAVCNGSMGT
ncbi:hypothetical protein CVIRNUC_007958 [Coccomyxa viridis]|uniref:Uncharacterized protein n=1 Tax=Coccomyxa viridis TaxID=1274662 RepID=A0AAV1IBP1_9CHLO|nr:hypothetical protein CVIRNUC_007958 [Coccomyxa viridis]